MKCKWAVMSTVTSTGEPSTWLLSSQMDELFLCHCPLLTSPGGGQRGAGRLGLGVGAGAEKKQTSCRALEPRGPFTPGRDLHPRESHPPPSSLARPPPFHRPCPQAPGGRWGLPWLPRWKASQPC